MLVIPSAFPGETLPSSMDDKPQNKIMVYCLYAMNDVVEHVLSAQIRDI